MTEEELTAAIIEGHKANKKRSQIADDLKIDSVQLDIFISTHNLSRIKLGFPPLFGQIVPAPEKPIRAKMSEGEITMLYAGRRYEDYKVRSSGSTVSMPARSGEVFTVSSMAF